MSRPGRALIAGLLLFGIAVFSARAVTALIVSRLPSSHDPTVGYSRFRAMVGHLDDIAATPQPTALFFGTSLTQAGVVPALMTDALTQRGCPRPTVFNLGAYDTSPDTLRLLIGRVREAFAKRGEKPWLGVLEITPMMLTREHPMRRDSIELKRTLLRPIGEIAREALTSPAASTHHLALRFFDGHPPWLAAALVEERVRLVALSGEPASTVEQARLHREIVQKVARVTPTPPEAWHLPWRGGPNPSLSVVAADELAAMARSKTDDQQRTWLAWRVEQYDAVDIHMVEEEVSRMVLAAQELRRTFVHSRLVVLPHNRRWITYSRDARERLARTLARIESESGVRATIDLGEDPRFEDIDFVDTEHLSLVGGAPKLAEAIGDAVGATTCREAGR